MSAINPIELDPYRVEWRPSEKALWAPLKKVTEADARIEASKAVAMLGGQARIIHQQVVDVVGLHADEWIVTL